MIDFLGLFVGVFLVSFSVAYFTWSKVRVVVLRQELFKIRDSMWDKARELNAFDDPAYKEARDRFNSAMSIANLWNVNMVVYLENHVVAIPEDDSPQIVSSNPAMQVEIEKAQFERYQLIRRYILFWRASGIFYLFRMYVSSFFRQSLNGILAINEAISKWSSSPQAEEILEKSAQSPGFTGHQHLTRT